MSPENFQSWKEKASTAIIGLLAAILGVFATHTFTDFQSEKKTVAVHTTKLAEHDRDFLAVRETVSEIKGDIKKTHEKLDWLIQHNKK